MIDKKLLKRVVGMGDLAFQDIVASTLSTVLFVVHLRLVLFGVLH